MGSQTVNSWKRSCSRQIVLYLEIGGGLVAVLAILVFVALLIPGASPDMRSLIISGGLAIFLFVALAVVLVWGVSQANWRAAGLDAIFAPYGLAGRPYLINGRQYLGQYQGRNLNAYFSRGPTLEIYLAANLYTRMAIGTEDALGAGLAQALKIPQLRVDHPAYGSLAASAIDEGWGQAFLADPQAREIIPRLARTEGIYELRTITVQPDALVFRLIHLELGSLTAGRLQNCLSDLLALARVAEALPPPAERLEPSRLERNSHYR